MSGAVWRFREECRTGERMDEGFPDRPDGRDRRARAGLARTRPGTVASIGMVGQEHGPSPLNQRCIGSALAPPRSIPNRDVKQRSAAGTGGLPAGRQGRRTLNNDGAPRTQVLGAPRSRGVEQWQLVGLITRWS